MTPEQRKAFLDQACAGAAEIRSGVESLLAALQRAGDFLADPTVAPEAVLPPLFPAIGSRIGPYTLRKLIGEGGTGLVFLAEQEQTLRRTVALKVIKAGMDSREVIARFEAERQALAMMDHPNIAKVFDAGTSEDGRPYFVMELVGGRPITEFCRRHRLPIRARISLFIYVCKAVQHAHQKGIVHRDLKPSNVLVAVHDRRPVPKVIDFGIAKALHSPLTVDGAITVAWQLMGTPQYMSPEQVNMSPDLDVRSDIYSLGAMLYELLSGVPPFDPAELASKPFLELQRALREARPIPPSRRVELEVQNDPELDPDRRHEQLRRSREIKGDLDAITLKALQSKREDRYDSASALADDLTRFLDNLPVAARPPTAIHAIGRVVRRHRVALITVCAALVTALIAYLILHDRVSRASSKTDVVAASGSGSTLRPQSRPVVTPSNGAAAASAATNPVFAITGSVTANETSRRQLLRTSRVAFDFDRDMARREADELILTDLSDQHNNATLKGGYFVPGVLGDAIHLTVDSRINTKRNIGIRQANPRTISLYLLFPRIPQGRWLPILGWGAGSQGRNFWLKTFRTRFMLWSSGSDMDWEVPLPVDANLWHHHVITYDGQIARWWVDGAEVSSPFPHVYNTVDTPLEIGGTEFSIDELAIFDRVLTPDKIALLGIDPSRQSLFPSTQPVH